MADQAVINVDDLIAQAKKVEGVPVLYVEGNSKVIDTGQDLELPNGLIVRNQTISQIVTRLSRFFPQTWNPELRLQKDDFYAVVETVLSMGLNPMLPGIHYHAWKQKPTELTITRHYAIWRSWLRYRDNDSLLFDYILEEGKQDDRNSRWFAKAACVPSNNVSFFREEKGQLYRDLVEGKVPPREAQRDAALEAANIFGKVRSGVVEWDEIFYDNGKPRKSHTPKGWDTGVDRAKVRAGGNAIKDQIGIPSFFDTVYLAYGKESAADHLPEIALETDDNAYKALDFDGAKNHMGQIVVQKGFGKRR